MKRRDFILTTGAAALLPLAAQAETVNYTSGLVDRRLAAGETIFVDFYTDWCTTCRSQGRTIDALKASNPNYEANITFVRVDWDQFSNDPLSRRLNIPRRSTLVVLKGNMQLGLIVAGTAQADIQALMDTALNAAIA